MMKVEASCSLCRFWDRAHEKTVEDHSASFTRYRAVAECRRRAPTARPDGTAVWPRTYSDDGCFEHEKLAET